MNELIKVDFSGEKPAVSARELHEFLEVETPYHKWFPRMCEYGFAENEDYAVTDIFVHNPAGGPQSMKDAAVSIDMAKEICMLQRNQIADRKIKMLEAEKEANRPKVLFADSVAASNTSILVGELAKLLKQNGVDTGQNRLFDWMRNNGYLIRREGTDYNMPTQRSMELGLFEIKETSITHADGHVTVNKTPKVTGKGQQFFINMFLG